MGKLEEYFEVWVGVVKFGCFLVLWLVVLFKDGDFWRVLILFLDVVLVLKLGVIVLILSLRIVRFIDFY